MRLITTLFLIGRGWALLAQVPEIPLAPDGLYFVTAAPTPIQIGGYETELYRLDTERNALSLVRKLGTRDAGMNFIIADFVGRAIVCGSPNVSADELSLIHMDAVRAGETIPLNLPGYAEALWTPWSASVAAMRQKAATQQGYIFAVSGTFLDRPGMGHWLGLTLASDQGTLLIGFPLKLNRLRATLVKPEILEPIAILDFLVQGDFGLVDRGASDVMSATLKDKKVFIEGNRIDTGIPAPSVEITEVRTAWQIRAHDGNTTVMRRFNEPTSSTAGDGSSPLYVFSSESKTWKTYIVPGSSPRIKMIGPWIMGVAASDVKGRESPGKARRRQLAANPNPQHRPITELRFQDSGKYFPGLLFLINTTTGSYTPIRTDQGDSEILLVDKELVYYRVNNQVFVASLTGSTLGPATRLVEDDSIPEVHWAFIGH